MVSSVAGGADPGRGAERLSERLFGGEPDSNQWIRSHRLEGCGGEVVSRLADETSVFPGPPSPVFRFPLSAFRFRVPALPVPGPAGR